ncbi:MAG: histidine ammonia-lyase [Armatimonadetes bacterium]|nr:histidine ammonia-lyase [Armatimonadota bacterium]
MNTTRTIALDGRSLTLPDLLEIAHGRAGVALGEDVIPQVAASRRVVDQVLARDQVVYGINTGFGRLSSVRVSNDQVNQLQKNLVRSHSAGVGEPISDQQVRALIALRINSLVQGYSGVRPELLEALVRLLEQRVYPVVPSRGSVGASGDLAPLAHVALGLMGEGQVRCDGEVLPAAEGLRRRDLSPFEFQAKEALALINGTQLMTAVGGLALERARGLLKAADVIGGMSLEALLGTDAVFHPDLHAIRPHQGQLDSADNLRRCLEGSSLILSHRNCPRVQDAYSLRCMPQVHGASREGWRWAVQLVEAEINSVTDNPVVFPDGRVMSGGNFHGAPVALVLDCAALALSYLGTISERRCDRLLNPDESEGLPPFLARAEGLNSGLMLTQYVAAALVGENKVLCHPASSDSIPTSAGHEDHVSMGPAAAYKLDRVVDHLEQVLACEWICASQALEFRRPLTFGPGTEAALAALREAVAPLQEDRSLHPDLVAAAASLRAGRPVAAAEESIGRLR